MVSLVPASTGGSDRCSKAFESVMRKVVLLVAVPSVQELTMKCRSNSDADAIPKTRPKAPVLPKPAGKVVRVATTEELKQALQTVLDGGTVLLAESLTSRCATSTMACTSSAMATCNGR